MKKILALFIFMLLLASCGKGEPSAQQLERDWSKQYNLLVSDVNAIEKQKEALQSDWLADLKADPQLSLLAKEEARVQKNILERRSLLLHLRTLLDESAAMVRHANADPAWAASHALFSDYAKSSLLLLEEEESFFRQIAKGGSLEHDGQYMLGELSSKRQDLLAIFGSVVEAGDEEEPVETPIRYRINPSNYLVESLEEGEAMPLLLTFDDVPGSGESQYALQIAQALSERGAGAIFFVYQAQLTSPAGEDTIRKLADMGFTFGNHSMHHYNLTELSDERVREEIRGISDQLEELTGERPRFFRPPYGIMDDRVVRIAREEGMITLNWTYGYDWEDEYQDPQELRKIMSETPYLRAGANLLMHDRSNTAAALPGILDDLDALGYYFVNPEEIAHE